MSRPWYSFYPADYGRDTGHLTLVEHGAYRVLMDHYYATETPLPADEARLLRLTRAKTVAERDAVRFVLREFFRAGEQGWRHKRIDAEIDKAAEHFAVSSLGGKQSAARRAARRTSSDGASNWASEAQPSQSQPQSQSKYRDPLFEEFWLAFPRKEARGLAAKAWVQALELAAPATLVLAAKTYAARRAGQEPNFTKQPANWLAQECWLDDMGPAPVDADAASRAWNSAAAPLVAEIGAAHFNAYFAAAEFSRGPPVTIKVSRAVVRELIERRYAGVLKRIFGEVEVSEKPCA